MSASQKSLDLFADRPLPTFLQPAKSVPPPRKRTGPPPRKPRGLMQDKSKSPGPQFEWVEERGQWMHYALTRVHLCAKEPARVRPKFQPELINARLFLVDALRPYPEWPLICKVTNRLAFEDKKKAQAYLDKHCPSASVYRWWECGLCKMTHFECYPQEVSGSSSGKANRKWDFLKRKGIEPEY